MPTPTYTLISEQVLGSSSATVTFSSVPQTYKDLVLEVITSGQSGVNGNSANIRFNSSSTGYSMTQIYGDGSSAFSSRTTNQTSMNAFNFNASTPSVGIANIMSYANTSIFKSVLIRSGASTVYTIARANLWQSTAAIISISVEMESTLTFNSGSTFRLWGVVG